MKARQGIVFILLLLCSVLAKAQPVRVSDLPLSPLATEWMQLSERHGSYTTAMAYQAFKDRNFSPHGKGIPSLGIGAPPIWLALELLNDSDSERELIFELANGWQDDIRLSHFAADGSEAHWSGGDIHKNAADNRFFRVNLSIKPGVSVLLLRVEGPDPRVLPVYLTSRENTAKRERAEAYSYGFLYGGIVALLGYNFLLYLGIGSRSYLYYSVFLLTFLWLNLSYTGHGSAWIWPSLDHWRQWSNPLLMTLYCITGLMFALRFLGIDKLRPRLSQIVLGLAMLMMLVQAVAFYIDDRALALIVAFDLVYIFSLLMPLLGIMAWHFGMPIAKLFLLASVSTMIGMSTTALTVDGVLPFNQWTYRAAEIGMFIDAMLLALALAAKFRQSEQERTLAKRLAATDPLTGVDNRRAFGEHLLQSWNQSRDLRCRALIMIDIDKFKSINDSYGHDVGDKVLTDIARSIRYSIRNRDHCGRWGGEEFVVLLPNATEQEIAAIAERIRQNIELLRFPRPADSLKVTASVGVCVDEGLSHYEDILRRADEAMYSAKAAGGNRIVFV
ncbi:GGDEF domain-containing protein [Shewanella sp. JM162201]|uniref:diguanylate cyclase n=1 Tax=Shewanella jiangmenensis TaxID=2837387 RepID=A0ABS5V021_9GAMM|nr:diguanylate cyclase [Shewanella jiangmenensis]MBT1443785.1 GGDEF domain-containing protein [Shewanella jiangmenensis]